eukprot:CAMPEP_0184033156 /NCGR_PEP_ID=MMETSP0955-20130417/3569_1 /TAXON_ID=627963 /ORGANISM="Aplanochytrium sp, Strain PBS07" /LENGTH=539 /DNA_ID=CAMNT_0026319445 /DNA_START=92 /DNA_END=1711 /DNA_ORIENTATION=-
MADSAPGLDEVKPQIDVQEMLDEANKKAKELSEKKDANDYSRFDLDDLSSDSDDSDDADKMTVDERIIRAESCKMSGNGKFKEKENSEALKFYDKGLDFLKPLESKKVPEILEGHAIRRDDLLSSLLLNKMAVLNREKKWKESVESGKKVMTLVRAKPGEGSKLLVKALFRRGQAYWNRGDLTESKNDLVEALKLDPKNRDAKKLYTMVREKLIEARKKEKASFGNIFSKAGEMYEAERKRQEARERKRLEKLREEYEKEKTRREKAEEPEISFEEWKLNKKKKEEEEKKKKEEEEAEKKKKEEAKRAKERKEQRALEKEKESDEIELDDEDLAAIKAVKEKGYCHFRKDKTADEIELLSHIRPSRLSSDDQGEEENKTSSESAWNQAKTWEEKDISEATRQQLRERVKTVTHISEDEKIKLRIKSVENATGEAQIVMVGGKKGPVYDLSLKAKWEAEVVRANDDILYDIDGDDNNDDKDIETLKITGAMEFKEITNGIEHFVAEITCSHSESSYIAKEIRFLEEKVRTVISDVVENTC